MKTEKLKILIFFSTAVFILTSCGKKLPPPSPDIFPAKIISGYYIPNSQIRVDFNEEMSSSFDSAFLNADSERIKVEGYAKAKSIFLNFDSDRQAETADIYGASDLKKNKRDYLLIPIGGTLQKDTMFPEIVKTVISDTTILIEFSEEILSCSIEIYPDYVKHNYRMLLNKIIVTYSDTCGYHPIQIYLEKVSDKKQNYSKKYFEKRFFNEKESLSFVSLTIDSLQPDMPVILIDSDGNEIFKRKANESGSVLFDNLSQGRYMAEADSLIADTLILK